ncbi:hypothetical protein niasHS_005831 [Heterodera schachtii]|uniref:C2H2-type domain-containing protein n=1 Tax=Heterodera schachtii TaxID=97005 RepID=A0ABD2JZN8_HETSC
MKLDNLLEQMMMMQQQQQHNQQQNQQGENEHGEGQQNVQQQKEQSQTQQKQQQKHRQQQQQQQQWEEMPQNNVGTATNGHDVQSPSGDHQNFVELSASTDNAKRQKADAFLAISNGTRNAAQCKDPFQFQNHQQMSTVGGFGENNGRESLPQHLESFSAFLRANLSLLSAFSPPSLPPQQNSILPPILPSPIPQQIVPLSKEIASQGLLAVGGCRPCHKTFASRLELIHHCIDHFPNVFYSFEERSTYNNGSYPLQIPKNGTQNLISNGGTNFQQADASFADSTQKMDILGQLAGFLAFNENGCSGSATDSLQPFQNGQNSLLANFFKSFTPMTFQQLTAAENGTKHLATDGTTENVREQPRKRANASSSSSAVSHPKQTVPCRPTPSSNGPKMTSAARKRQLNNEKAAANGTGKGLTEDGPSNSSLGSSKNHRKINTNGGDRHQNGGAIGGGGEAGRAASTSASPTASAMPTLSELPYPMCPYCCLTFAETSAFRTHLTVHESEVTASASSPSAGAPFSAQTLLLAPTDADRANGGAETAAPTQQQQQQMTLKCSLCEMKFVNAFRLAEHMRLHSAHTCNQCQKTFMTAFDLNLHMGTHTGFTYDCKDCGKCFPCRKTLAEHNRSHRMILSGGGGGSASPELSKKAKMSTESVQLGQQQQEREQSPDLGGLNSDSGSEKRRLRVAKRGEKSRRNATLVAVERAVPSPPIALPKSTSVCSAASSSTSSGVPQFSNGIEEGETEID